MITLGSIIILASFVTAIISATLGMAGGMILMGIYALILPVGTAMIMHGVTQMIANGIRCWFLRRSIYFPGLFLYAIGSLSIAGALSFLAFIPHKGTMFILLGLTPFVQFVLPSKLKADFVKPWAAILCGVLVTGMQILSGVGGPLLDIFFINTKLNRHQIVATKSVTQVLSHFMKLIYYGALTLPITNEGEPLAMWIYGGLFISSFMGTMIGARLLAKLSDKQFINITRAVTMTVGAFYLAKGISLIWGHVPN